MIGVAKNVFRSILLKFLCVVFLAFLFVYCLISVIVLFNFCDLSYYRLFWRWFHAFNLLHDQRSYRKRCDLPIILALHNAELSIVLSWLLVCYIFLFSVYRSLIICVDFHVVILPSLNHQRVWWKVVPFWYRSHV